MKQMNKEQQEMREVYPKSLEKLSTVKLNASECELLCKILAKRGVNITESVYKDNTLVGNFNHLYFRKLDVNGVNDVVHGSFNSLTLCTPLVTPSVFLRKYQDHIIYMVN